MGKMKWVVASCLFVLGVAHAQDNSAEVRGSLLIEVESAPIIQQGEETEVSRQNDMVRSVAVATTASEIAFEPLVTPVRATAEKVSEKKSVALAPPRYQIDFTGTGSVSVRSQQDMVRIEEMLTRNALHYQQVFPWIHNTNEPLPLLKVRYFTSLPEFRKHLVDLTNETSLSERTDFMTIEDGEGNVVLYMYAVVDQRKLKQMLNRHGFVQFNMATAPATPAWVREGFALYFEDLTMQLEPTSVVKSRSYLRNLHELRPNEMMFAHQVLVLTEDELADVTEGSRAMLHSWAMVNFLTQAFADGALIEANEEIRAIFINALSTLDLTASFDRASANTDKLATELNNNLESLDFYFSAYLTTILNHQEAYDRGVEFFRTTDFEQAVLHFEQAAFSLAEYYQPNYVLGLLTSYRLDILFHQFTQQQELHKQATLNRNITDQNTAIEQKNLIAEQIEVELAQMKLHLSRAMDIIDEDMVASTTLSHEERRKREEFRSRIAELNRRYEDEEGLILTVAQRGEPLPPRSMTAPY